MNWQVLDGKQASAIAAEIMRVRRAAWEPVIGSRLTAIRFGFDDFDRRGWHVHVRNTSGQLIAASRLCLVGAGEPLPDENNLAPVQDRIVYPAVFLNRAVVHPDYRGQQLWQQMTSRRVQLALQWEAAEIWAEMQGRRIDYLESVGFERIAPSGDRQIVGGWELLRREIGV